MKSEIKVPSLGESISEVTIGSILANSGSQLVSDQEILELETDKVNQLLYAPHPGTLTLNVKPGDIVKIGQVIGFVEGSKESAPAVEKKQSPPPALADTQKEKPRPQPAQTKKPEESKEPLKKEKSIQKKLSITRQTFVDDLKEGTSETVTQPQKQMLPPKSRQETRRKMSKIRKVIAKRLVEAQHTTAMLTTFNEVDLYEIIKLRELYKEIFVKRYGVKLGFMSFFVKAVVAALAEFPDLNSYIDQDEIVHRDYYSIGIAVGTDKGVIVPVVNHCDQISFSDIELEIEKYAKKARDGTLVMDDLQGAGFTITNGGVYGSLLSTPIINPPQSGILGMHKIEKRAVVIDDQVVIRPMMYLALSYDHRIVDGKEAVSFLVSVKKRLEDPSRLLLNI